MECELTKLALPRHDEPHELLVSFSPDSSWPRLQQAQCLERQQQLAPLGGLASVANTDGPNHDTSTQSTDTRAPPRRKIRGRELGHKSRRCTLVQVTALLIYLSLDHFAPDEEPLICRIGAAYCRTGRRDEPLPLAGRGLCIFSTPADEKTWGIINEPVSPVQFVQLLR
jgi:hypothetical protein